MKRMREAKKKKVGVAIYNSLRGIRTRAAHSSGSRGVPKVERLSVYLYIYVKKRVLRRCTIRRRASQL